jgi:hypothetical protein
MMFHFLNAGVSICNVMQQHQTEYLQQALQPVQQTVLPDCVQESQQILPPEPEREPAVSSAILKTGEKVIKPHNEGKL